MAEVHIVNTLIASLYVYKMMVLPKIPDGYVKRIEDEIRKFVWNDKKPKISLEILQNEKHYGGLKLVSLRKRDMAFKTTWIKMIQTDYNIANMAYLQLHPILKSDIWNTNMDTKTIKHKFEPGFWTDVLLAWTKYCERGLKYYWQLWENNNWQSLNGMHMKYGITFLEYNSLIQSIPISVKQMLQSGRNFENQQTMYERIIKKENISQIVYCSLISNKELVKTRMQKWKAELCQDIEYEIFLRCFVDIHFVTNVPKYRSFQYRLLMRIIVTNIDLYKWKLKDTDKCTFCKQESESYLHLFIYCEKVQPFWVDVEELMKQYGNTPINFAPDTVLMNRVIDTPGHVKNFICL